jgi:hypothetical protein
MSNFVTIKDKDGVTLGELPVSKEGGRLRNIIYMTESGTYEKPAWLKFVRVKGVGGGGGGGGCAATSTAQKGFSGSGSGGGYFEKRILAAALAESETVTIGAMGSGGAAGNNTGSTGGTTSFGAHCSATGGAGGGGSIATPDSGGNATVPAVAGSASGGDVNLSGFAGGTGRLFQGGTFLNIGGGFSHLSGQSAFDFTTAPAPTGSLYGGGGCGTYIPASSAAKAGGNGAPGIVIIEEYE